MLCRKFWIFGKSAGDMLEEPSTRKTMSAMLTFSHSGQEKNKVSIALPENRYSESKITDHKVHCDEIMKHF